MLYARRLQMAFIFRNFFAMVFQLFHPDCTSISRETSESMVTAGFKTFCPDGYKPVPKVIKIHKHLLFVIPDNLIGDPCRFNGTFQRGFTATGITMAFFFNPCYMEKADQPVKNIPNG